MTFKKAESVNFDDNILTFDIFNGIKRYFGDKKVIQFINHILSLHTEIGKNKIF